MKLCTKCGQEKQTSEFHAMRRGRDGLNSWCKACMRVAKKDWREKNRDRESSTARAWRARNPEKTAQYRLKALYGLTPEERERLGDRCQICSSTRNLAVDHDHRCCAGERSCGTCIRGLLCGKCNIAIGHFDDDPARLRAAIDYLGATCS